MKRRQLKTLSLAQLRCKLLNAYLILYRRTLACTTGNIRQPVRASVVRRFLNMKNITIAVVCLRLVDCHRFVRDTYELISGDKSISSYPGIAGQTIQHPKGVKTRYVPVQFRSDTDGIKFDDRVNLMNFHELEEINGINEALSYLI